MPFVTLVNCDDTLTPFNNTVTLVRLSPTGELAVKVKVLVPCSSCVPSGYELLRTGGLPIGASPDTLYKGKIAITARVKPEVIFPAI